MANFGFSKKFLQILLSFVDPPPSMSFSASSLLFLLFWFSPVILYCPYFTGSVNIFLTEKGVTITSQNLKESYGKSLECARNAFEEAVRCQTKLNIPNFKLFSDPNPPFLGFDFENVTTDPKLEEHKCYSVNRGACNHFTFHFQRPSLTPNQTMVVWECMGDLVNTDTLHECPNLENKLLIHIRNGDDVLKNPNYLQPPFSSLLTTIYAKRFSFSFFFFIDLILYFSKQIQDGMNWWSYLPTEIHSQKGADQSSICSML